MTLERMFSGQSRHKVAKYGDQGKELRRSIEPNRETRPDLLVIEGILIQPAEAERPHHIGDRDLRCDAHVLFRPTNLALSLRPVLLDRHSIQAPLFLLPVASLRHHGSGSSFTDASCHQGCASGPSLHAILWHTCEMD